jgi:hypothetical protein
MNRPVPTPLYHFTHVSHLASIVKGGLLSDTDAVRSGSLIVDIGNAAIKERRRGRLVPIGPGGAVSDYVPFYLAPRSPMMFAIHRGNVPTYDEGCARLIYLLTSAETLAESGTRMVFTDRNAALAIAAYGELGTGIDSLVDWALMEQPIWRNTPEDPDRRERRMAECLAHRVVRWPSIEGIATASQPVADEVRATLASLGVNTPISVRPQWYF